MAGHLPPPCIVMRCLKLHGFSPLVHQNGGVDDSHLLSCSDSHSDYYMDQEPSAIVVCNERLGCDNVQAGIYSADDGSSSDFC